MSSPRRSSSGVYSTIVSTPSGQHPGVQTEIRDSTLLAASMRLNEFLVGLPSRGWLGKVIFDAIIGERDSSWKARDLGTRCWQSLIAFDNLYTDLRYRMLSTSAPPEAALAQCEMYERCWEKCVQVLKLAGSEVVSLNPAYLRSPYFSLDQLVKMLIVRSLESQTLRYKWIRTLNLLDSVVRSHASTSRIPGASTPGTSAHEASAHTS
jgi:hypothetical protein